MTSRKSAKLSTRDEIREYNPLAANDAADSDVVSRNSIGHLAASPPRRTSELPKVPLRESTSELKSDRRSSKTRTRLTHTERETKGAESRNSLTRGDLDMNDAETTSTTRKIYSQPGSNYATSRKGSIGTAATSSTKSPTLSASRNRRVSEVPSGVGQVLEQQDKTRSSVGKHSAMLESQVSPMNTVVQRHVSSKHVKSTAISAPSRRNSTATTAVVGMPAGPSTSVTKSISSGPKFINPFEQNLPPATSHAEIWANPRTPEDTWESQLPSIHPADSASQISDTSTTKHSSESPHSASLESARRLSSWIVEEEQLPIQSSAPRLTRAADTVLITRSATRSNDAQNMEPSHSSRPNNPRRNWDIVIVESPRRNNGNSRTTDSPKDLEYVSDIAADRTRISAATRTKRNVYHNGKDNLTSSGEFRGPRNGYLRDAPLVTVTVTRSRKVPYWNPEIWGGEM